MRIVRKCAQVLAAVLGCGLIAWFGVALAMEIAEAREEAKHFAD